jgi:hypothetical protein
MSGQRKQAAERGRQDVGRNPEDKGSRTAESPTEGNVQPTGEEQAATNREQDPPA